MSDKDGAAARHQPLLPKDWKTAPRVWHHKEPHAFWTFALVNFFFGTLGIWLPLANALLGGRTAFCAALRQLLENGGLYMYAVPFLAATVGVVILSLMQEKAVHSRGTKILFTFVATSIFVVCAILLQIQVHGPDTSVATMNFVFQIVVSLVVVVVCLYMHAIIQNEMRGSPQSDMQENAADLQERAQLATSTKKDFE